MMKLVHAGLAKLGLNAQRQTPPPSYVSIMDGVLVTASRTEVVLSVTTANTDGVSLAQYEAEVRAMNSGLAAFQGKRLHLKLVWGTFTGDDYEREMAEAGLYTTGDWQRWVADRATSITSLAMPQRHVYLLVEIDADTGGGTVTRRVSDAFGYEQHEISDRDATRLIAEAQRVQKRAAKAGLACTLASPESIAWMLQRETQHGVQKRSVHPRGTIEGSQLVELTRSAVQPYSDHLQIKGPSGETEAYTTVLVAAEYPEEVDIPGGEWILDLASLSIEDEDGYDEPLSVDVSIRFTVLPPTAAQKKISSAAEIAAEQISSATEAGVPHIAAELQGQQDEMSTVVAELRRSGLRLIEFHPRFTVSAPTYEALQERVDALTGHMAQHGITVRVAAHEQRQAWLETLAGDTQRITDCGHIGDIQALTGSLFWGGSDVGEPAPAPIQAWKTGASPGFVRYNPIGAGQRGDAPVMLLVGVSGRGKSVAGEMQCLEAAFMGAWVLNLDFKGDLGGLSDVAAAYGLPGGIKRLSSADSGALDPLPINLAESVPTAARILELLSSRQHAEYVEDAALEAVTHVVEKHRAAGTREQATTHEAIQWLAAHAREDYAKLGRALVNVAKTPAGTLIVGPRLHAMDDITRLGLWNLQLPMLTIPPEGSINPLEWDASQKASVAALRAAVFTAVSLAHDSSMRRIPKFINVPECHRILGLPDGVQFLESMARIGRAQNVHLALDTQDATGPSAHPGIIEQISTMFVYQLKSDPQQNAAAKMLGLAETPETRATIHGLATLHGVSETDVHSFRKGHCIMKDFRDRTATIQWELVSDEVLQMLDTSAYAQVNRAAAITSAAPTIREHHHVHA